MKQSNVQRKDTLAALPESVMMCATIDHTGKELEITELMIRRACEQMDADQLWPYASNALNAGMRTVPSTGADIIPFRRPGKSAA